MRIDVHHHFPGNEVLTRLNHLTGLMEKLMPTLDETLAAVEANSSRIDSLQALMSGLKAQLDEALSGTTLPPAVQAKVDAIFTAASAQAADIDESLNANTPPPTPTP